MRAYAEKAGVKLIRAKREIQNHKNWMMKVMMDWTFISVPLSFKRVEVERMYCAELKKNIHDTSLLLTRSFVSLEQVRLE